MENKSRYATKFYVVLMMLSLVSQLFVPVLQVAAVEVPTVVTEMTAKSTGENTAELNLSLNNTSSEKKSEQIELHSSVSMIPGSSETLVSTEGKMLERIKLRIDKLMLRLMRMFLRKLTFQLLFQQLIRQQLQHLQMVN